MYRGWKKIDIAKAIIHYINIKYNYLKIVIHCENSDISLSNNNEVR